GGCAGSRGCSARDGQPPGGSTLITSAPRPARISGPSAPREAVKSRTRYGLSMKTLLQESMQRSVSDVQRRAMSDPALVRRDDPIYTATLLFAIVLAGYMANGRTIWSWDTLPARYLPFGILRHGTFYLDDFPALYAGHPQWETAL